MDRKTEVDAVVRQRPFGSICVGAEMAAAMGKDPRPFLTPTKIQEQLTVSGMTRQEWDAEWEKRLSAPF